MKRTFIEFAGVTRVLHAHDVTDEALLAMQRSILQGEGDLITGTGGLRKIRCATRAGGKSGGIRVLFAACPAVAAGEAPGLTDGRDPVPMRVWSEWRHS